MNEYKTLLEELFQFRIKLIEKLREALPENSIVILKNCYLSNVANSYPTDCTDCIFIKINSLEKTDDDIFVEAFEYIKEDDDWVNNGKMSIDLFSMDELYIILNNLAYKKDLT